MKINDKKYTSPAKLSESNLVTMFNTDKRPQALSSVVFFDNRFHTITKQHISWNHMDSGMCDTSSGADGRQLTGATVNRTAGRHLMGRRLIGRMHEKIHTRCLHDK